MPAPTRKYAFASIKVFEPAHGDPLCTDPGLGWYSILSKEWEAGTSSVDARGRSYLQSFPETGLIHRAFLIPQDTRLAQFTTTPATWEEERQSVGGRRVYKLTQYDHAETATSWSAATTYHRPLNAPVAFTVKLPDTPSTWDYTTYVPFFRIELNTEWGIEFVGDGTFLVRYVAGAWRAVQDLPTPPKSQGFADEQEMTLFVRVEEGQLGVSSDFGNSYTWYAPPGETVTLAAGAITFRGRGTGPTVGVHQLRLYTATFDSFTKLLERARASWTVSFAKSRSTAPLGTGGSVVFSDLGVPLAKQARYRITLTPGFQAGTPFTWYFGGSVRAVHYRIPPVVQTTGTTSTTPFDSRLIRAGITKPPDLDGGNASFTFAVDAFEPNDFEPYRWRRMEVWLGWRLSDDSLETYSSFVGYAEGFEAAWGGAELNKVLVTFHLHNGSARFKRSPWTPFLQLPLAGQTPNAAADEILAARGLNAAYRSWFVWGASGAISPGSAEDPNELTKPTELPWETLKRIMAERNQEVGVDDTGVIYTLPKDYVASTVTRTFSAGDATSAVWDTVRNLGYRVDWKEAGTAAFVYGTNEGGQLVFRYDVDSTAETDAGSSRFCPWTECRLRELSGTPDDGLVTGHCQSLAQETFQIKREGDLSLPLDPTLGRRDKIELVGFAGAGIPDNTQFVVTTLAHTWETRKGYTDLETQVGLRRLN